MKKGPEKRLVLSIWCTQCLLDTHIHTYTYPTPGIVKSLLNVQSIRNDENVLKFTPFLVTMQHITYRRNL